MPIDDPTVMIKTPADAAALFCAALPKVQREERVFVLPLDAHGRVLAKPILVSVGLQAGTAAIDPGAIFREALKAGAEEIVVAHNHPSGDPTPSKADIAATAKLREAAKLLGVTMLDHIILGSPSAVGGGFTEVLRLILQALLACSQRVANFLSAHLVCRRIRLASSAVMPSARVAYQYTRRKGTHDARINAVKSARFFTGSSVSLALEGGWASDGYRRRTSTRETSGSRWGRGCLPRRFRERHPPRFGRLGT